MSRNLVGLQFWADDRYITLWGFNFEQILGRATKVEVSFLDHCSSPSSVSLNSCQESCWGEILKKRSKKRKEKMLVWIIFATISTGRLFPGLQAYFCSKYWKFNWKHLKIFQIKFKIFEILKIKFVSSLHIFLSLKYICFLQQLVDQPWLMIFETVGERCRIPIIGDYPRFRGNLSQGILPSSSSLEKTSSDSWWHHKMQLECRIAGQYIWWGFFGKFN